MSVLLTQCLCGTVQTETGKVDPARKFKCTTGPAVREVDIVFKRDIFRYLHHCICKYIVFIKKIPRYLHIYILYARCTGLPTKDET